MKIKRIRDQVGTPLENLRLHWDEIDQVHISPSLYSWRNRVRGAMRAAAKLWLFSSGIMIGTLFYEVVVLDVGSKFLNFTSKLLQTILEQ
jgi:hypothetical protein